ncbi:MAG: hypothetical protein ACM31C_18055 [Acidobacteriota bacterium]
MKRLAPLVVLAACGGSAKAPKSPGNAAAPVPGLAVSAFVPDRPSYLLAAPKLRDAQVGIRGAIDALGVPAGVDAQMASQALQGLLDVDPLNADPAASIGIDVDGGVAIFSENLDPTIVVHLASPPATEAFFERERKRGMVTQSVIVDGVEVFDARLAPGVHVGWAVDHDWLFVHFQSADPRSTDWFQHAHHPTGATWAPDWQWAAAQHPGASSLLGFVKLRELVGRFAGHAQAMMACAKLVEPVARVGLSLDAAPGHVGGRIALDLGPTARDVASHALPPPPGWVATSANAAVALQLNVDADAVAAWVRPCVESFGGNLARIQQLGVRAARAMLLSLDPDEAAGTGAVAVDLDRSDFLARQLDKIPMRSHLESDRTFGAHRGHHLKIPFTAELDYVLEDKLGAVAMGDGVLAQIFAPAAPPAAPPPLARLDVTPSRLSAKAWEWLLGRADIPAARTVADMLQRWRDGHISLGIEGDSLVLEASGNLK